MPERVDTHVIACGVHPVDIGDIHAIRPFSILDGKALRAGCCTRGGVQGAVEGQVFASQVADQLEQLSAMCNGVPVLEYAADPLHRMA